MNAPKGISWAKMEGTVLLGNTIKQSRKNVGLKKSNVNVVQKKRVVLSPSIGHGPAKLDKITRLPIHRAPLIILPFRILY